MMRQFRATCIRRRGFTLVELMVAMSVVVLLLFVTLGIVSQTQNVWQTTTGRISAFREGRAAFEALTRRLSQATLNPYFDYVDASGKTRQEVEATGGVFIPDEYVRQSELHFVAGQAEDVLQGVGTDANRPGHAVFFQAPLGFTDTAPSGDAQLTNLLNAVGYYVEYGDDSAWRPDFLDALNIPVKNRYRLMQMVQSTDRLRIYDSPLVAGNRFDWFREPLKDNPALARPVADNVLMAVIWPRRSKEDVGSPLSPNYAYDSKGYLDGGGAASRNQLPPFVQVALVAVDEPSAARLEEKFGGGADPLKPGELFETAPDPDDTPPTVLDLDLAEVTDFLTGERMNFRVFSSNVLIRQSKFSAD